MPTERRAAFDPLAAHTGIRHAVPHLAEIKKPMLNFSLLDIRFPKGMRHGCCAAPPSRDCYADTALATAEDTRFHSF